jgi:hypothetical protein
MDPANNIDACDHQSECFAFHIDTRMTDTLDTDPTHFDGTETTFSIPTSGYVNGNFNRPYSWIVDWGDGASPQTVSGYSGMYGANANGIPHDYASTGGAGEYQITIRPSATSADGWLDAFGFYKDYTNGANVDDNKYKFLSIDTPFTGMMRTPGLTNRFAYIFYNARNGLGIPTGLFSNISTVGVTNLSYMFHYTFYYYAQNSTTATIPQGLFDSINTTSAANLSRMFEDTFSGYASHSATATIPQDLFNSINTSSATNLNGMFIYTFYSYAQDSTTATIPQGLFDSINTISATDLNGMFCGTFYYYASHSTTATIPQGLFDSINTTSATDLGVIFYNTFSYYAQNSTTGTIPQGLFDSIDTSSATDLNGTFDDTFSYYAQYSTTGTIPSGLFDSINTSSATDLSYMFAGTFRFYARNSTTATIPSGLFDSITIPSSTTDLSRMFNGTFQYYAQNSTTGTIPQGLFDSIDTTSAINFTGMFGSTFVYYAYYSTTATIPQGLFDSIDTTSATDLTQMFSSTFSSYAYCSTTGTIPSGLFDSIDTTSATNLQSMFSNVFSYYAQYSATATIPQGLFDSINTSSATDLSYMFASTFFYYASYSTTATIPQSLFDSINTTSAIDLSGMFDDTFYFYAQYSTTFTIPSDLFDSVTIPSSAISRSDMFSGALTSYTSRQATFIVAGSTVSYLTQYFHWLYSVKIGVSGTPSDNPTVAIGDKIYPTYNETIREITAPTGDYANYTWYFKDGTSCVVAEPTIDCGPQDNTTMASFPNTTEWTPDTSTEKGNVTFYSYNAPAPTLELTLDSDDISIGGSSGITPTLLGTFAQGSNTLTTTTNSPHGYSLSLSTNLPSSDSNASDMSHQSLPGNYLLATDKTCTWNDTDKSLNTPDPLPNNSYGFTLDLSNLSSQKLCQVPNSTSPLTVKSTTNADETGDATTIYYGAKIDTRQLAGDYKATIVYTAIANP